MSFKLVTDLLSPPQDSTKANTNITSSDKLSTTPNVIQLFVSHIVSTTDTVKIDKDDLDALSSVSGYAFGLKFNNIELASSMSLRYDKGLVWIVDSFVSKTLNRVVKSLARNVFSYKSGYVNLARTLIRVPHTVFDQLAGVTLVAGFLYKLAHDTNTPIVHIPIKYTLTHNDVMSGPLPAIISDDFIKQIVRLFISEGALSNYDKNKQIKSEDLLSMLRNNSVSTDTIAKRLLILIEYNVFRAWLDEIDSIIGEYRTTVRNEFGLNKLANYKNSILRFNEENSELLLYLNTSLEANETEKGAKTKRINSIYDLIDIKREEVNDDIALNGTILHVELKDIDMLTNWLTMIINAKMKTVEEGLQGAHSVPEVSPVFVNNVIKSFASFDVFEPDEKLEITDIMQFIRNSVATLYKNTYLWTIYNILENTRTIYGSAVVEELTKETKTIKLIVPVKVTRNAPVIPRLTEVEILESLTVKLNIPLITTVTDKDATLIDMLYKHAVSFTTERNTENMVSSILNTFLSYTNDLAAIIQSYFNIKNNVTRDVAEKISQYLVDNENELKQKITKDLNAAVTAISNSPDKKVTYDTVVNNSMVLKALLNSSENKEINDVVAMILKNEDGMTAESILKTKIIPIMQSSLGAAIYIFYLTLITMYYYDILYLATYIYNVMQSNDDVDAATFFTAYDTVKAYAKSRITFMQKFFYIVYPALIELIKLNINSSEDADDKKIYRDLLVDLRNVKSFTEKYLSHLITLADIPGDAPYTRLATGSGTSYVVAVSASVPNLKFMGEYINSAKDAIAGQNNKNGFGQLTINVDGKDIPVFDQFAAALNVLIPVHSTSTDNPKRRSARARSELRVDEYLKYFLFDQSVRRNITASSLTDLARLDSVVFYNPIIAAGLYGFGESNSSFVRPELEQSIAVYATMLAYSGDSSALYNDKDEVITREEINKKSAKTTTHLSRGGIDDYAL